MTTRPPASAPCAPRCDVRSLPHLLAGALMRHRRNLAGLSLKQTQTSAISAERISEAEAGRYVPLQRHVHTLLRTYDTPAHEAEQVLAFLSLPAHEHRIDNALIQPPWVEALTGGSRSVHVYCADPALLSPFLPAASPPQGRCRAVLFLDESLLERPRDTAETACLSTLVRLAEAKALTVHLVPAGASAPAPLIAEYFYTRRQSWDGSASDRLRRQIFLAQHDNTHGSLSNGPGATAERQITQHITGAAHSSAWSLNWLRQASRACRQPRPGVFFHTATPQPAALPPARRERRTR
ncbi:hypothetical protein AB0C52_33200 [Streptomyces sp. NPDC048717]|uniref:hypothetical protein n=1 Tax=Streptomyces sp. NPDC048717 TaxID=3154928 RepID=UPI0034204B48